jgi:hypothetical protein
MTTAMIVDAISSADVTRTMTVVAVTAAGAVIRKGIPRHRAAAGKTGADASRHDGWQFGRLGRPPLLIPHEDRL